VLSKRLPASEARLVVIASALLVFSHTTTKFTVSPHEHCLQKEMRADHEAVALHTISDVALLHWTSATLLAGERLPRDDASDANAKRKHDRKKDLLHNHLFFSHPRLPAGTRMSNGWPLQRHNGSEGSYRRTQNPGFVRTTCLLIMYID
jgi:hypothetical protein